MTVPATIENMKKYYRPSQQVEQPDGSTVTILPRQPIAYSPNTDEEYSANPGDYFTQADDWTMTDSEGEPMILVFEVTRMVDADEHMPHTG